VIPKTSKIIFDGSKILSVINLRGISGSLALFSNSTNAVIETIVKAIKVAKIMPSVDVAS
jgi:hypothetical protein